MLVLESESCLAAIRRGQLKHSWLENQVLNKTPDIVVMLRRGNGWPVLQRFTADTEQALALADEIEFGFSPARLVSDCAPLAALPEELRHAIREVVHTAYLECFDTENAAQRIRETTVTMKSALLKLLDEWDKPDDALSDAGLQSRWRAVLDAAEPLRDALDALPKGIVLP